MSKHFLSILLTMLTLQTLACVSSQLPTKSAQVLVRQRVIYTSPPTDAPTAAARPTSPAFAKVEVIAGRLQVRACPSTDNQLCPVVGWYTAGALVEVGALLVNDNTQCGLWYPLRWRGEAAWICAEWVR